MTRGGFTRRRLLCQTVAAGAYAALPWRAAAVASAARVAKANGRHCILLWMAGGPSQLDTFDMKPGHANGGTIKPASTCVPGISFSEHLPKLAEHADSMAILRGMSTSEGDHERGTVLMRTGHRPGGPVAYPSITSSLAKSLGEDFKPLPDYVTIAPSGLARVSVQAGFLGPQYAPMAVAAAEPADGEFARLHVEHLDAAETIGLARYRQRLNLWRSLQEDFLRTRQTANVVAQHTVYESAQRMLESDQRRAFDLSREPDKVRSRYGRGAFGQGCLLARRLVEQGVPMVEVTLGQGLGWDTHQDNFTRVQQLSRQLDVGWAALMSDLAERGLLEKTTILWAGEFGRTPIINSNGGRDHYPQAFTAVLAGGGIAGGQVHGATSADGMEVVDGKTDQQSLLATLCSALGVDPSTENLADGGRPIAIAEGQPVTAVLS